MKTRLAALAIILPCSLLPAQGDNAAGAGDSAAATGGARPPQMNEGFIGRHSRVRSG
jgi:hypothetical protein